MENKQNQNPNQVRNLRLVLPKKGRLKEDFQAILDKAALANKATGQRLDYGRLTDNQDQIDPIETLAQRSGDAIENLDAGLADMAIVGLDTFEEIKCKAQSEGRNLNVRILSDFNISACSLYIATPDSEMLETPAALEGKRVATSYPHALRQWLKDNNVNNVQIIARDGGIEDYVRLGVADYICDVVDTGNTLRANGLKPCLKLFDSKAILIQRKDAYTPEQSEKMQALAQRFKQADTQAPDDITIEPSQIPEKQADQTPALAL